MYCPFMYTQQNDIVIDKILLSELKEKYEFSFDTVKNISLGPCLPRDTLGLAMAVSK